MQPTHASAPILPSRPPHPIAPTLPPLPSRSFIQSGFNYDIVMDQSGTITAVISIPSASYGTLRAKPKAPVVIGRGKATAKTPGKVKLKLLLSKTGKARLKKLGAKGKPKKLTATMTITVKNGAGQTTTIVRKFVIKA